MGPWRAGDLFPAQVVQSVGRHIRHTGTANRMDQRCQTTHSHAVATRGRSAAYLCDVGPQWESSASAASRAAARGRTVSTSWWVRHIGGYFRDESPDRARGWQDVDTGLTGVCGDRLLEQRAAAATIGKQPFPEVG